MTGVPALMSGRAAGNDRSWRHHKRFGRSSRMTGSTSPSRRGVHSARTVQSTLTKTLYGLSQPDEGILVAVVVSASARRRAMARRRDGDPGVLAGGTDDGHRERHAFRRRARPSTGAARRRVVELTERTGIRVDPTPGSRPVVGERQRRDPQGARRSAACSCSTSRRPCSCRRTSRAVATIRRLTATGLGVVHLAQAARGGGNRRPGHRAAPPGALRLPPGSPAADRRADGRCRDCGARRRAAVAAVALGSAVSADVGIGRAVAGHAGAAHAGAIGGGEPPRRWRRTRR